MNFNIDTDKRKGIIGTAIFHVIAALILFVVTLNPPDPPRPEIGMEINLGYSDQGMGDIQPPKPVKQVVPEPVPETQQQKDNVVTQNTEESIRMDNNKTEVKKKPKEVVEKTEDKVKEPVKKVINQDFVFKKKDKTTDGGSEGKTGKPGDQGKENGTPTATNYEGVGGNGNGIAYSLNGRAAKNLSKPTNNSSEQGTVVIQIWVDRSGKVINTRLQISGTNTSSTKLQNLALQAAAKARFNSNSEAAEVQKGTITYKFVL